MKTWRDLWTAFHHRWGSDHGSPEYNKAEWQAMQSFLEAIEQCPGTVEGLLEENPDLLAAYHGRHEGTGPFVNRFHVALDLAMAAELAGRAPLESLVRCLLTLCDEGRRHDAARLLAEFARAGVPMSPPEGPEGSGA